MLRNLFLKAVGWGVAAIAVVVVLGLFVFNQMDSSPGTASEKEMASARVFRAKIPAVGEVDKPTFINRVSPKAEETAPRAAVETKETPPVTEQPAVLAKVPPQPVKQPQIKPPPLKPVAARKATAKNTIYRENWLLDQEASFYTLQVLGVRNDVGCNSKI